MISALCNLVVIVGENSVHLLRLTATGFGLKITVADASFSPTLVLSLLRIRLRSDLASPKIHQ
jgi:hypothetical protein